MRLFSNQLQDVQKVLVVCFSFSFLANVAFFCLWALFLPSGDHLALAITRDHLQKEPAVESFIGGPLFLREASYTPNMPDLAKEMTISLLCERPDRKGAKRGEIFLTQSRTKKLFESGEKVFFSLKENGSLQFSEDPSLLWMELQIAQLDRVDCRAGIGEKENLEALSVFSMRPVEGVAKRGKNEGLCFQKLLKAKWFGEDFRSSYLQTSSGEKKKEHRLEIDSLPLFISEGDLLFFQNQRWACAAPNQPTQTDPIAYIASVKDLQMDLESFDEMGNREKIVLNKQLPSAFKTNPEEWISSIRERSQSSISLGLEKQHFLLHKGGWLFRKDGRWRAVRPQRVQMVVAEAFFFFEGIELKEEQKWVKGIFFNGNGVVKALVEKKIVSKKKRNLEGKASTNLAPNRSFAIPSKEESFKKEEK
jgi:hypothetical protein